MGKDVCSKLLKIQELWTSTEPISGLSVPDGNYDAILKNMEVTLSKKGSLMVAVTYRIMGTAADGREIMSFYVIENPTGMGFFMGFSDIIGFKLPGESQELPDAILVFMEEFTDICQLEITSKDGYQNVAVMGLIPQAQ